MNARSLRPVVALRVTSAACLLAASLFAKPSQVVVDTGQVTCYDNSSAVAYPRAGQAFSGQDAEYVTCAPHYQDNGDGTVTDLNTGLMWSQAVVLTKVTPEQAERLAADVRLGDYSDWRVPNIKELYSLIDFRGRTGTMSSDSPTESAPEDAIPYINTDYFSFAYGQAGERYIDAQWLSSTRYVSEVAEQGELVFGVNFADGRIKGYGMKKPGRGGEKTFYVRFVRGASYGDNDFVDNGDGTVSDRATGLMWTQADSGRPMSWKDALAYANASNVGGYSDWRLPDAKELQYLVDYTRSPDVTQSPAIDPVFSSTAFENEAGQRDWGYYWTSTSHLDGPMAAAVYVAFGRALGQMRGQIVDVHGAGAQRSDPKVGNPEWRGPQGDRVRVQNYVRLVRGGQVTPRTEAPAAEPDAYPALVRLVGKGGATTLRPKVSSPQWGGPAQLRQGGSSDRPMPGREWSSQERLPSPPSGGGFISRHDSDRDGKVSPGEFPGPDEHFRHFDRNGDGYLSADEAPTGPPPGR